MKILADRFDPRVVSSLEQLATVGVDGSAQRGSGMVFGGGSCGLAESRLELPKVTGDLDRCGLVVLANLGEHIKGIVTGTAEAGAQVAEGAPELLTDPLGSGVRPQRVDGLVAAGAFGADQVP